MKENLLIDKSIAFASRIAKLHQHLIETKKETIISKQIVRSGTSIGANINEANYGQSKADFISKMHIALSLIKFVDIVSLIYIFSKIILVSCVIVLLIL